MSTTRAAVQHDQQSSPTLTQQMPQGQTHGQRQPEHVSESSPPLHRYLGNSYVQAMTAQKQRLGLHAKLTVNEPGDIYEQEADRVADQVMAASTHTNISSAPLQIQRFAEPSPGQGDAASASVAQTLASPGRPLEPVLRQDMEQRFSHDFSRVRIHTDAAAEQSARDVHARAYTMGHHIVFGAGRFAPETMEGRRLLAHELTHVAQMSAFGSPAGLTAALRLPILRQPENGADVDEEERRRRVRSSLARLDESIDESMWKAYALYPSALIDWAKQQQIKFEDPQRTDEERLYIARGLLGVLTHLRALEGTAERDRDGALTYSGGSLPWTQDRARKLDDIAPFTAANIAEWREAEAWRPPVTSHVKQSAKKKTPPPEQPAELPERRSFAVNVTFPKQEGMTFKTEEGQRRIAFALISSTQPEYTEDQIAWSISRIDLSKWWAPPSNLGLRDWQEAFEATAIGDKFTMGLSEKFILELENVLREAPIQRDFNLEGFRQGVLGAAPTTYLAYAAPAGLMAGTIIGSGLALLPGTGAVGGGGLTTGGSGLLTGGEGSLLLGATIRQSALYTARHFYINAPRLYGNVSLYTGAITSGVALGEHLREVRSRGPRWSDLPRVLQDIFPFFAGYTEWRIFRGSSPPSLGEEPPGPSVPPPTAPPVSGPKPIPAKVSGSTPPPGTPPAPVGPAGAAKNPPISFPRRDFIQGPFPTPPAKPAAPPQPLTPPVGAPASVKPALPAAPVPPIKPKGFRGWLFGTKLKLITEGIEPHVATKIGTGDVPAVTAKATPSPAVPTPDRPPQTPARSQVVGPPKTEGAVVTPAPVTPASPAAPGHTVGTPALAPKPVGTTPQAQSFGWVLPRFLTPQSAYADDRSAAQQPLPAEANRPPESDPDTGQHLAIRQRSQAGEAGSPRDANRQEQARRAEVWPLDAATIEQGTRPEARARARAADFTPMFLQWEALGVSGRKARIERLINAHLAREGIPPVKVEWDNQRPGNAQFDYSKWVITLSERAVSANRTDKDFAEHFATLVANAVHEGDHTVTTFRGMRVALAEEKYNPNTDVPGQILAQAIEANRRKPPSAELSPEALDEAREIYEVMFAQDQRRATLGTVGVVDRNAVVKRMKDTAEQDSDAKVLYDFHVEEVARLAADGKRGSAEYAQAQRDVADAYQAWQRAHRKAVEAHNAYVALPEETVSWRQGASVKAAVLERIPLESRLSDLRQQYERATVEQSRKRQGGDREGADEALKRSREAERQIQETQAELDALVSKEPQLVGGRIARQNQPLTDREIENAPKAPDYGNPATRGSSAVPTQRPSATPSQEQGRSLNRNVIPRPGKKPTPLHTAPPPPAPPRRRTIPHAAPPPPRTIEHSTLGMAPPTTGAVWRDLPEELAQRIEALRTRYQQLAPSLTNEYRDLLEVRPLLDPRFQNLPVWSVDMIRLEREFSTITEALAERYRLLFDVAWNQLADLLGFDPELWSYGNPE